MLSRRQFLRTSAGASGAVVSSGLWLPALAHANQSPQVAPRPIPGGTQFLGPGTELFHAYEPLHAVEPLTIFDFQGVVGIAHLQGTGTGTNTRTGTSTRLVFDVDNRFMRGVYVGVDGKKHTATFGFI
jgi:hypothetical protein